MRRGHPFRIGDWVEVKSASRVLATLDRHASLDGLLFMPEMVRYCGQRLRVAAPIQLKRRRGQGPCCMSDTVNLETRCDGSGHNGCSDGCLMLWKAAWLTPADGPAADAATANAERLAEAAALSAQHAAAAGTRCQFPRSGSAAGMVPRMATPRHLVDAASRQGLLPKFLRQVLDNRPNRLPAACAGTSGEERNDPDGVESAARRKATAGRFAIAVRSDPAAVMTDWEALEPQATAFQTRAWLLPLYRIVAPKFGATPLFVTVRDRDSNRPLMLLPLCIRRRWGLVVIEFPDFGVTDYNAPLLSAGIDLDAAQTHELWGEICARLPPADMVLFDKVPGMVFGRNVPLTKLKGVRIQDQRAWALSLPKTREEYDRTILRSKDRKEQRRKRRNLIDSVGALTFVDAANEREGREIFQAFRQQRRVRFKETGYHDILNEPVFLAFWETVIFEPWGRFASLCALKAGDRIVATLLGLRHNDSYLFLAQCFECIAEGLSPGIVAMDEMVTHLIESGTKVFDFTLGNEGYKRQFGVEALLLHEGIWPLSPRGWLFLQAVNAKRHLKAAVYPRIAAYWSQARNRLKMLATRAWRLIRRGHSGDGCGKQGGPAAEPCGNDGAGKARRQADRVPDVVA